MAHGSSVMRPLSSGLFSADKPAVETGHLTGRAFRVRTALPHAEARGLALLQLYCGRLPAPHRPHVSISEACPPAWASGGIPPQTPCGWHLLRVRSERTYEVPPFPAPIARLLRAVRSTGVLGSACRAMSQGAGAVSCALWLQCVRRLRWVSFTVAPPPLRLCCPEMPARRDTRSAAARLRRFSLLHTLENQSQA
jgi:hypothetical protein